jgi:hypothetical protein
MHHAWVYKGMFIKLLSSPASFSLSLIPESMPRSFVPRLKIALLTKARIYSCCFDGVKKTRLSSNGEKREKYVTRIFQSKSH